MLVELDAAAIVPSDLPEQVPRLASALGHFGHGPVDHGNTDSAPGSLARLVLCFQLNGASHLRREIKVFREPSNDGLASHLDVIRNPRTTIGRLRTLANLFDFSERHHVNLLEPSAVSRHGVEGQDFALLAVASRNRLAETRDRALGEIHFEHVAIVDGMRVNRINLAALPCQLDESSIPDDALGLLLPALLRAALVVRVLDFDVVRNEIRLAEQTSNLESEFRGSCMTARTMLNHVI